MLAALGLPGPFELFVLAFIVVKLALLLALVAFVFRTFPKLMRGLGRGIGEFQRGVNEGRRGQ